MAFTPPGSIILLILISFVASHIRSFIKTRRFRAFAQAHGADDPPHAPPSKLPWAIYPLYRVLSAERRGEDLFDDILIPRFKAIGYNTYVGTGLLGEELLYTIDARNIQAILATNFKDWAMGPRRQRQFGAVLGKSIFTSDGADWAHFRGMARPLFTRDNINDLDATEKAYQDLKTVIIMSSADDDWTEPIDLAPLFYRFTLDAATKFLFGQSVNSQLAAAGVKQADEVGDATSQAAKDDFAEAFAISQNFMGMRIRLQSLYWLVDGLKYRRAVAQVRAFANHYVKLALKSGGHGASHSLLPSKYTLLEAIFRESQNPTDLCNHILSFLVAGRDTTANLLSWLFVLLARNPTVFSELRAAIETSFGSSDEKPDFATLKSCRYLQYVLLETLRLYPPIPVNNRIALRDTVLPTGGGGNGKRPLAVRKGQVCLFFAYGLQRRVDVWGPEAAEFKPERWEGRKMDWAYIPFSGGPRVCLGQQYALTEVGYLVVRMLQAFEAVEWCGRPGPPRKAFGVTMSPRDGVVVRFRRASGE